MFASASAFAIFGIPMSILINLLLAVWLLVALLMVLVILMQRPKSEGLGAAFGGAVTENIFGAQTTNVLVKFTAWLAAMFFLVTFVLSILYARKSAGESALRRELMKTQAAAPASPAPAAARPSPASSAAPDSGAGVLPAGSATPIGPFGGKAALAYGESAAVNGRGHNGPAQRASRRRPRFMQKKVSQSTWDRPLLLTSRAERSIYLARRP
jgi:preprotein translocase subunit SecG